MDQPRRPAAIRKSDLSPAFEAAWDTGYDRVCVEWETVDGLRFQVTAAKSDSTDTLRGNAFDQWEADRAS